MKPRGKARALELFSYGDLVNYVPEKLWSHVCSAGNPFSAGYLPKEGECVADLGCGMICFFTLPMHEGWYTSNIAIIFTGSGADSIIAANLVGPKGYVYAIDATPAMAERARLTMEALVLGMYWQNRHCRQCRLVYIMSVY